MSKIKHTTVWKKNDLPDLIKRIKNEQAGVVSIGVQGSKGEADKKGSDGDLTVLEVATFHEFGTINVPERSFIRSNDFRNKEKYKKIKQEVLNKFVKQQMTLKQGLGLLGLRVEADIKEGITQGIEPELRPETIARKGSSTPLIDTGQLRSSITHKVDKK